MNQNVPIRVRIPISCQTPMGIFHKEERRIPMKYILASASPRRRELLARTGIEFTVIPSVIEEIPTKSAPADIVMELAQGKAMDVWKHHADQNDVVIGADTIVAYNGEILGKPACGNEALDMLSMLADRTHQVYTGVSIIHGAQINTFYECTDVTFYPIHRDDLLRYIASGDPLDKAGAYGIQGDFSIHVKCIRGDYSNVVGLPIGRVYQELIKL